MTTVKEWIDKKIGNKYIRYFEYDKFSQIVEIGRGGFGKVSRAILANTGLVALKIILNKNSDEADDEFIKELKLLREVDYHPKINRFLGITKDCEHYILVLEYADGGNLRGYLKKKFTSLKWNDKIQMALDITDGLKFLHSKEIVHRDLHSKNILVNNGKLLIADLGLSKKLAEIKTNSPGNGQGISEYIDPQYFKDFKYKKNKKSDIYSLGVLLWEISSGYPPFSGHSRNIDVLIHHINKGIRENPIKDTPPKYQQLYQACWDDEPKLRPNIEVVDEILNQLKDYFDLQSSQSNIHNDTNSKLNVNDSDDLNISSNDLNPNLMNNQSLRHDSSKFTRSDRCLQDEKQPLVDNLVEQLKQNRLVINQLEQEKINIKEKLIQMESNIQELNNQQDQYSKNQLIQSQIAHKQTEDEKLKLEKTVTYYQSSQDELKEKQLICQNNQMELVNLQQLYLILEQDYQKLRLNSTVQIACLQNENQALASNLTNLREKLKQNHILQKKSTQTEVNIQGLKSRQESLIEQIEQSENELIKFQVNYEKVEQKNIILNNMVKGLAQDQKFTVKLNAVLEKEIVQLQNRIVELEQFILNMSISNRNCSIGTKIDNEEQINMQLIKRNQ